MQTIIQLFEGNSQEPSKTLPDSPESWSEVRKWTGATRLHWKPRGYRDTAEVLIVAPRGTSQRYALQLRSTVPGVLPQPGPDKIDKLLAELRVIRAELRRWKPVKTVKPPPVAAKTARIRGVL